MIKTDFLLLILNLELHKIDEGFFSPHHHSTINQTSDVTGRIEEIHQRKGKNRRADKTPSSRR